mgnify:CR=1 FL=1
MAEPVAEKRTRLVYVSPLKALSYDVEKNLRAPLKGIGGDDSVIPVGPRVWVHGDLHVEREHRPV